MRVIIMFNLAEPQTIIYELMERMLAEGIDVSVYDFVSAKKYDHRTKTTTSFNSYMWAPAVLKLKGVRRVFIPAINKRCIEKEFNSGDIVHIHYVLPQFLPYIDLIKQKGCRLVTTFWGSDYLRADAERKKSYSNLLQKTDRIGCTKAVAGKIVEENPFVQNKTKVVFFGVDFLKKIIELTEADKEKFRKKFDIPSGKTIITLGYSADPLQHHEKQIDALLQTGVSKNSMHLLVPMTYGGSPGYKQAIKQQLINSGISFTLFEDSLSVEDVVALRCVSDIVLNIQASDAFSGSISESIQGGNVLVVGDWLPYGIYKDWGITLVSSKMDDYASNLKDVIDNLPAWKIKTANNKKLLWDRLSWDATYPLWKALYNFN